MAGFSYGQKPKQSYDWVNGNPVQRKTPAQQADVFEDNDFDQQNAAGSMPQYTTSPLGMVSQYNRKNDAWDEIGYVPGTQMVSGGGSGGSGGGGGGAQSGNANNGAMLAKLDEVWRTPAPTYDAEQVSLETDVNPADEAYVAASKDRIGNMASAGMRALDDNYTRRGFGTDSRMQRGDERSMMRGMLSEFATGERDMVQQRQDRNRNITDANAGRTMTARSDNQRAQMAATDRLTQLLGYYGMLY